MALRSAPPGFNSTLVQLKEYNRNLTWAIKKRFNSTLVQLKAAI